MAYQNIGTPRFYISLGEYLNSIGGLGVTSSEGQDVSSIGFLNPSNPITISTPSSGDGEADIDFTFSAAKSFLSEDKGYFAILGHNFASQSSKFSITDPEESTGINETEIINSDISGEYYRTAAHDGFTIFSCNYGAFDDESSGIRFRPSGSPKIGCVSFGNFYDMPHSPDLNLNLTTEYDGIKTTQTKGGATLSNALYTKPADWGNQGAWQLGTNASNFRSGRRSWDLSFSYFSDTDIMPINASQSHAAYSSNGYNVNSNPTDINTGSENGGTAGQFQSNILDGDDFFSQVINRTMGGHLPFIFQPDNANNNPDQFAICRFEMDSITYTQVANNTYNLKLKIREVW